MTSEYYQTLLALLNDAIAAGDLSGGSAFDKTTLLNLEQQAQSFASLPTATAGARAMDDSFNYPLSLLLARLRAISAEAGNFTTTSGRLLDILANETRSLPGRANNMLARAGEDRSLGSPSSHDHQLIESSRHPVIKSVRPSGLPGSSGDIYIVGPVFLVTPGFLGQADRNDDRLFQSSVPQGDSGCMESSLSGSGQGRGQRTMI